MIDLHAHFLPPEYVAAAERAGHLRPDGRSRWPEWSARQHLATMDATGIEKAILSVPSPGVHFGDDFRAQVLARRMNETAAELGREYPGRFGFFASLPLPDVEGAVAEADYAYDVLHADGVVVLSNAGGFYPGDPSWEPLWRMLNDRSATVLLHPTSPPQWRQVALDRPRAMIEFPFETARAVADLVVSGFLTRFPDVSWAVVDGELMRQLSKRIEGFTGFAVPALPSAGGSGYCCTGEGLRRALTAPPEAGC